MFQPWKLDITINIFLDPLRVSIFFLLAQCVWLRDVLHTSEYTGDSLVLTKIYQLHSIDTLQTCPHHFFKNIEAPEATYTLIHTEISEGRNATLTGIYKKKK